MTDADRLPVLWLCGPPGVGKTTVGWRLHQQIAPARAGYVDIDQLGICYPDPPSDPGRHRLKARTLGVVTAGLLAEGARCVVVSGVVDSTREIDVEHLGHVELTVCRLRADRSTLASRFDGREPGQVARRAEALAEADALDAGSVGDVCVDTTGRSVDEVVRDVLDRTGWPDRSGPSREAGPAPVAGGDAGGPVIWLCGATGVGKSAVGFTVYRRVLGTGEPAAYVDLAQLGFGGTGDHRTRAATLAAMWQAFRSVGARALVIVGPTAAAAAVGVYEDALPAATVTLCRLHAGPDELAGRIQQRGRGGAWAEPGDPLRGRSAADLRGVVDRAVAEAAALERSALGVRIDTDGRGVDEVADLVSALPWRAGAP